MSRESLQILLDCSPVAHYHQLKARDDGSVECHVRLEEAGADGYLHPSVIDLMLRAVGHGLVDNSTMEARFQMDQLGKVALGAVVVATGRISGNTGVDDSIAVIEAEVHEVGSNQRVAWATYCRRRK